jgi:homoserine dehydrogenase
MDSTGAGFAEAVEQAQALGYAEADPTADVEGFDAAAKAAILASLAFHTRVSSQDVHREGITEVTAADVQAAREMDCVVKLLAICERTVDDAGHDLGVSVRVYPAMIPRSHPLGSVRDAYNAVFVEATAAGELMFYGKGAGGDPTASAVLGDVVAVARHRVGGGKGPGESAYAELPVLDIGSALTRYHISLDVADRPGVLAQVATAFAEHGVSIETVRQQVVRDDETGEARANLIVVTHTAPDSALSATVDALARLATVDEVTSVMRVEGS